MPHIKVKWSRYRPGVAQRVGRDIVLLYHDHGARRGWVVIGMPRPYFTPGKEPVRIVQKAGWAPGPVWTGGKSCPHRDSIPDRPACSQSLYRLIYRAHNAAYSTSNLHDELSGGFPVIVRDFMFYTRLSPCFHEINWKLVAMTFSCSILCVCVCGGGVRELKYPAYQKTLLRLHCTNVDISTPTDIFVFSCRL